MKRLFLSAKQSGGARRHFALLQRLLHENPGYFFFEAGF
jgi:hypothetical protein